MEFQRDVWRPLLLARDEPDADWDWLADFEDAAEHSLEWEAYALIEPAGLLHGLMSIKLEPDTVYVDCIAVAPWNREGVVPRQRLLCGTRLLVHAMRRSVAKGYGGRIALHSLDVPHTLKFYREHIRMAEVRTDLIGGMHLRYFELSDRDALRHIEGENS